MPGKIRKMLAGLPHRRKLAELDERVAAARADADTARQRQEQSARAVAAAQALRRENRFGSLIADSLGVGRNGNHHH